MKINKKIILILLVSFFSFYMAAPTPAYAMPTLDEAVDSVTSWFSGLFSSNDGSSSSSSDEESSAPDESTLSVPSGPSLGEMAEQSYEQVRETVRKGLDDGQLPPGYKIKGIKKNDNGTFSIAVGNGGGEEKTTGMVVEMSIDEKGHADFHLFDRDGDASKEQEEYDAIVQGTSSNSEGYLTEEETEKIDSLAHTEEGGIAESLGDMLGVSAETAASTLAGGASLLALALAGAGKSGEENEENLQSMQEAQKEERRRTTSSRGSSRGTSSMGGDAGRRFGGGVNRAAVASSIRNMPDLSKTCDPNMLQTIKNRIASVNGDWQGEDLDKLASHIVKCAEKYHLSPILIAAQLEAESGFSPYSSSPAGAQGIAQFMPETAAGFGIDPMNVEEAIDGQCQFMSNLYNKFGDYSLALAGYNAGQGAVEDYGGIPPYAETQAYVSKISMLIGKMNEDFKTMQ